MCFQSKCARPKTVNTLNYATIFNAQFERIIWIFIGKWLVFRSVCVCVSEIIETLLFCRLHRQQTWKKTLRLFTHKKTLSILFRFFSFSWTSHSLSLLAISIAEHCFHYVQSRFFSIFSQNIYFCYKSQFTFNRCNGRTFTQIFPYSLNELNTLKRFSPALFYFFFFLFLQCSIVCTSRGLNFKFALIAQIKKNINEYMQSTRNGKIRIQNGKTLGVVQSLSAHYKMCTQTECECFPSLSFMRLLQFLIFIEIPRLALSKTARCFCSIAFGFAWLVHIFEHGGETMSLVDAFPTTSRTRRSNE